jgi:hypothetical protein
MGNPGAGPRWLAKARHKSAFPHWKTAAAATSVRHQKNTKGEASWRGMPKRLINGVLTSTQKQTQKRLKSGFKINS